MDCYTKLFDSGRIYSGQGMREHLILGDIRFQFCCYGHQVTFGYIEVHEPDCEGVDDIPYFFLSCHRVLVILD